MLPIEEIKDKIKKNTKWILPQKTGGQTVGMPNFQAHLVSEDIDFEIKIAYYRNYIKNQELAFKLFELALDDVFKE